MKKIILISLVLTMLTGIIVAQSQRPAPEMQQNVVGNKGYLFMENDKLLHIMDETGMGMKLQNEMTLQNGTIIKPDGSYQLQNGPQLQLRNGEIMDMDGIKYKSERKFLKKTHRKKVEKTKSQKMHSNGHQQHSSGSSSGHQH